jgi:uncharacterized protein (DUF1778 family)
MDIHSVKGGSTKKISTGYAHAMADENRKHSQGILLRFEPEQLDLIERAAEHAALNRTAWLRTVVLRAAREELGEATARKAKR